MSKERFEGIAYNVGISLDGEKALMRSDDYDFLYNYALEQAERVQELESESYNAHLERLLDRREQQIKRYREALEKIRKEETVTTALSKGQVAYTISGLIANEALEGEE